MDIFKVFKTNNVVDTEISVEKDVKPVISNKAFETRQQYFAFRNEFRKLAREKRINSEIMMIFHTIRGKTPYFGFSPVSNPRKLTGNCMGNPWFNHENRVNALKTMLNSSSSWAKTRKDEIRFMFDGKITDQAWEFLMKNVEGGPK